MKPIFMRASIFLLASLFSFTAWAQVTGTVTDGDGIGLPGVNIIVVGTSSGTVTDIDGKYSINAGSDAVLRFSYLGFETQEIPVGGQSTIDVTLGNDANVMNEVLVIGYGSSTRESLTGAVSSIGSEEIDDLVVTNVAEALQGQVAGVQVVGGGAPGVAPQIQVRGIGSISFGTGPLYVIDGYPAEGGLNSFDTRDIASINVLKDASATAIYGSRASNGVIIIETKKGQNTGGIKMNLQSTVGFQYQPRRLDLMNTSEYLDYADRFGAVITRNLDEAVNSTTDQTYRQTDTDWQDVVFQNGLLTQNTLSLSGGNETSRVYSSIGYYEQEGVMIGTPYQRYNFRINSDHSIGKRFTIGQNLTGAFDRREKESFLGGRTQLLQSIQSIPYQPVLNPDNVGGFSGANQGFDSADPGNPVLAANLLSDVDRVFKLFGNVFANYEIADGLDFRVSYGAEFTNFNRDARNPIYESTVDNEFNSITRNRNIFYSPLYNAQLSYNKILGDHSINAVVVGEIQEYYNDFTNISVNQTVNTVTGISGGIDPAYNGGTSVEKIRSVVGRFTYGFKDNRYLLTASVRRDGSSIFAPGRQTEIFPAAAVAWRISEEPFMAGTGVSELKLRASYGRTGTTGLGPYAFQELIVQDFGATFGGGNQPAIAFTTALGNEELEWEITDMLNIGIDVGFLNNRLNFSAEYYDRNVDNLILNVSAPPSSGGLSTIANIGSMTNSGLEFQGRYYAPRKSSGFNWDVSVNLSANTNEVLSLAQEDQVIFGANDGAYTGDFPATITRAGDPIGSFFGFQTDGIFQSQAEIDEAPTQENAAPGDIRFVDVDGDGVITAEDRTVLGSYIPDFSYGVNFNATYNNFDFRVFFQGTQGNDIYNGLRSLSTQTVRLFNGSRDLLNSWTPQNTNTDIPAIRPEDPNNNRRMSDRFLEDGSYLRLKNITVGYRVPFNSGAISSLRVFLTGQNLITITGYSGLDPEIGGTTLDTGFDNGDYPQPRSILFGVQADF